MNLSFRLATDKDILLIQQLAHKIWHEHYPSIITTAQINYMLQTKYSAEALRAQMQNGEQFFLVYANDEAIGYASAESKNGHSFIPKFYIDISQHRKGIGAAFFNYLLRQIPSQPIRLQVNRKNIKAINFYFRMGFVIESTGDFPIGNNFYMNDFVMLRR